MAIKKVALNGHFGCSCYHPLFVLNQFGDLERCGLRPGHVHSAEGWRELLEPVVARYRDRTRRRYFRADAAFATPEAHHRWDRPEGSRCTGARCPSRGSELHSTGIHMVNSR